MMSWLQTIEGRVCTAVLFLLLMPAAVFAHAGGTPQIINEPAGAFVVSVWTLPDPLTVDDANIVLSVAEPTEDGSRGAGRVVVDAAIRVELTHAESGETVTVIPTHEEAVNKLFYESYFTLPQVGAWTAEVQIDKDGRDGRATFAFTTVEASGTDLDWTWIGFGGVLLLGIGWFVWQSRSPAEEEA